MTLGALVTRWGALALLAATLVGGGISPLLASTANDAEPAQEMHPLDQMVIAFQGNFTRAQIKTYMDRAMKLYGLPITRDNYSRAGSVLVTMRKGNKVPEMAILDYMIRSYVPGVEMSFVEMAALSATMLALGDQ